jgi:hypothetical protein
MGTPMPTLVLAAVLGVVAAVLIGLGIISMLEAEDLSEEETVLTVYGER